MMLEDSEQYAPVPGPLTVSRRYSLLRRSHAMETNGMHPPKLLTAHPPSLSRSLRDCHATRRSHAVTCRYGGSGRAAVTASMTASWQGTEAMTPGARTAVLPGSAAWEMVAVALKSSWR